MGVNRRRPAHAHFVCHAETTAKLARTAGVLAQGASLDDDRTLGFGRFYRRVVRVTVIKTHSRAHAVLIVLGAPTTTWMADMRPEKAPGRCIETMWVDGTEIGVRSGDRTFRTRRRQRTKNRIAHGHRHGHPDTHRRRLHRAHHSPRRKNDLERPKRAVVDRQ